MEHDQRICPRCGKPAGMYRFCEACRAHIDSLTRVTPRSGTREDTAAQARQAVLRLEQALAAAAQSNSDRVVGGSSAAAVQTAPAPGESDPRAVTLARPELAPGSPRGTDQRAGGRTQAARAVARFEEVMTVTPSARAFVAPPAKREAFWCELAPSLKRVEAVGAEELMEDAPAVEEPVAATTSELSLHEPAADDDTGSEPGQSWMTAVCLLILIALVLGLTGRAPRRPNR